LPSGLQKGQYNKEPNRLRMVFLLIADGDLIRVC
jgi:hypothetical protein